MKKLMFAAASVMLVCGAQAVTCVSAKVKDPCGGSEVIEGAGSAHTVTITLKTTANKGKVSKAACEDEACIYWREQTTKKINGLIWAQLEDCNGCVPFGDGYAFWTKDGALDVEFAIGVGLIGKGTNSNKIEAYGTLSGEDFGELTWAGFGSMSASITKNLCDDDECVMYVQSITGGIAGKLLPQAWDDLCQECDLIEYDGCCGDLQLENTAAYGTIKISYDKSVAKKVALAVDEQDITALIKLPSAAALDFESGEVSPRGFWPWE